MRMDRLAQGRPAATGDNLPALTVPYLSALAMVALSTIVGGFIAPRWGSGAIDLLFLPAILAAAILFGLWPALLAGLASALAYNFFFTPPYHTFRMDRPSDIVTMVILFLVATVTSKLAASVREQAELANAHATRNATVAGFAARLLSSPDKPDIALVTASELARLFNCNAIVIEGLPRPMVIAAVPASVPVTPNEIATATAVLGSGKSAGRGAASPYPTDWQFHPIRSGAQVLAAVGLVRDDESLAVDETQQELLASLLDQAALALERARLEREARELSALRERDATRSALLSSLGRELGPPIRLIGDAVRRLRRSGSADKEITSIIGTEANRLDRYVSNLLELELDAEQKPMEFGGVTIDLIQRRVLRDGAQVHLTPKEYTILSELAKHPGRVLSHAHLLRTAWGPAQENQTEYLRVAIRALRQKLELQPSQPKLITNEPGVGYRLVA